MTKGIHGACGVSQQSDSVPVPEVAIEVTRCTPDFEGSWDAYVRKHTDSTHCHLSGWRRVFREAYGLKDHYLLAHTRSSIRGVLPLFYMRGLMGKGSLISMPFLDTGGILADSSEVEMRLMAAAVRLATSLRTDTLEFRHTDIPRWADQEDLTSLFDSRDQPVPERSPSCFVSSHKVRMLMVLPPCADDLMTSFKSKLRSQIRKPVKEGCEAETGGSELVNEFYRVFAVNMRDLGSPVHSRRLFTEIFEAFPDRAQVVLIRRGGEAIAGSVVIGHGETLSVPWASSLRSFSHIGPNMLLYWSMLEYASGNGYRYFDFGRSSPFKGTFRFKEQWGATPHPLNWCYVHLGRPTMPDPSKDISRFKTAVACWKRLPVPLTKIVGPLIRKHIGQ